jgi:glycosyltransferase involved in cell wall biosynthesis
MRFLMLNWRDPQNPLAGGAERVSLSFLRGLRERGHDVYWFAYAFPGAAAEGVLDGIRLVRAGGVGTSIVHARRWCRRQPRFDLVIDQHHGLPWFAPWWCRTRCVAYIHEVLGPIWRSFYSWPVSWLGACQERWVHWLYRRVPFWVPSASTRRDLQAHGVRDVTCWPNGIDPIGPEVLDAKPLLAPLRLVAVSRLAPNKRVDHAVRAVAELRRGGCDARLTIVGSGAEAASLRALADRLHLAGAVTMTGSLTEPEKNAALRDAHLLLHTSVREGWGLNVIEANAMGTPAVVYPVSGLVDSTLADATGWVAAAETPEALAAAIRAVAAGPASYDRCRQRAWERARTFYWDRVLPQVSDWLECQAAGE